MYGSHVRVRCTVRTYGSSFYKNRTVRTSVHARTSPWWIITLVINKPPPAVFPDHLLVPERALDVVQRGVPLDAYAHRLGLIIPFQCRKPLRAGIEQDAVYGLLVIREFDPAGLGRFLLLGFTGDPDLYFFPVF